MGNGENGSGEEIKIIPWIVLRLRVGKETKPVGFRDDVLHLGRSSECEVYVHDKKASRKHAMIRRSEKEVTLFDLGSFNGTKLNGEKIRKAELNKGDRIKIGQTEIEVVSMFQPRGKKEIPKDNPFLNALISDEPFQCQYCGMEMRKEEHLVSCRKCDTLHHRDCWEEGGECTTYACRSRVYTAPYKVSRWRWVR